MVNEHLGIDAVSRPASCPTGCSPVEAGARSITVHDLTRFVPPEDSDPRRGAVLMLFGEGPTTAPTCCSPSAPTTCAPTPARCRSRAARSTTARPRVQAALREAQEETGLDPAGVEVFAELPELWLPPSNFAVTPVLGWWREPSPVAVMSPDEVHAVYRVPIEELLDPEHRITVRHPSGWIGPGFLIGDDKDVILWGFTAGIITRLFDYLGWAEHGRRPAVHDLPTYMLAGDPSQHRLRAQHADFDEEAPRVNLLDWCLLAARGGLRPLGLLAGLHHRRLRHRRPAARRPVRHLAGADRARRRRPVAVGLARRAVHRDPGRVARPGGAASTPAPGSATRSPGSRPAPSTRSAAPCSARVAVLLVAWALGVAISGSRIGPVTPHGARVRRCSPRSTTRCRSPPATCCRRSTTSSAPASSRATSSRSRPSGSSRSRPAPQRLLTRPRRACAPRPACSRSAAATTAAAASRAPASSTPPTG